jgi:hypothetical protein
MTERPQDADRKMPPFEALSVFLLTCGTIILLYAGYLWVGANMSIGELRDRERELHRSVSEERRNDDNDREAAVAAAREEQSAIQEEIKQLREDLSDLPRDERNFIEEDISELNERLVELQREINEEKSGANEKPVRRREYSSAPSDIPPELREKLDTAKMLALVSLFFIVPGLLLRLRSLLKRD